MTGDKSAMRVWRPAAAGAVVAAVVFLLVPQARPVRAQDDAGMPEFYSTKVKPVFASNCYRCHGGLNHRGGLAMDTKAGLLKGGKDGAVLVPGDPERSLLVRLIRHEGPVDDPMPMPPRGKLSDADIATVTAWVKAGAVLPDDTPKP